MDSNLAFIFPGQGAQYPGMGKDFFDQFEEARDIFLLADDLLNFHFSKLMFEADIKELSQTKNAQLALYIHSMALLKVIEKNFPHLKPAYTLGLSLGEYSAICAAKKMSFESGVQLVKKRGELMQLCAIKNPGTMAAVFPAHENLVQAIIQPFQSLGHAIFIANLNSPGQVVIAGTKEAIDLVTPLLKDAGIKRVIFLEVSGAFHTPFMKEAQMGLEEKIAETIFLESPVELIMNVTGKKMQSLVELKDNLIKQVVSIVYWQKSIETAVAESVTRFIEIGAGKTLTNMNKKMHEVPSFSIEKVIDLDALSQI